jgi:hypothetical protein
MKIKDIDELKNLSDEQWYKADILEGLFDKNHWGGVNQAIRLQNNYIGVIGHVSHQSTDKKGELKKYYLAMSFIFDPNTLKHSKMEIIAERDEFPESKAKRSELEKVVFPGGIDIDSGDLYCGLSDSCIGRKKIKNPFNLSNAILEF